MLELLWPRFEYVLELNIHSIQNTDPQKLGFLDTRPHYVRAYEGVKQLPLRKGDLSRPSCLQGGSRVSPLQLKG